MISLSNITLTFPDGDSRVTAIDNASLEVTRGTVTGITGPSGSGKSSLLAVAATLIAPDSGLVSIDGVDVTGMTKVETARLRRETVGVVFQQPNLLPSLTATEQLTVMNELGQRKSRRRHLVVQARAAELLDAVGLSGQRDKRPHQLSGGQRQRINIARALMNDPSVLIVDEPTSALDQERGSAIIDLVLQLTAERETATMLVTHDRSHLPRMHDVLTMTDGRLLRSLSFSQ
ncbi:ABC transporter ATP-binding protein [Saxibacter everestensis]|uniref:ABC transporter ATP-binding protein n=1 Tax=Saxibacter everestensis TaxID=2909229 RepID=A0ABY8QS45_9MICO|nr:ABC transporter ATP-binding protein [Brevibacteriaceae bacterium ZFBP1038]